MAYKDKDKQREANRRAQAKFKAKGITSEGITSKGITNEGITEQGITAPKVELPACVPVPVRGRYARGEPDYMQTIDRLVAYSLDELRSMGVWIPVWRYNAGEDALQGIQ